MKNIFVATVLILLTGTNTFACPFCNTKVREGISASIFYPNLLAMLSAFIVLALIVVILAAYATKRYTTRLAPHPSGPLLSPVPLITSAMVLGIGIGGFIDGIILHQLLQWHEMLSNKIPATDFIGKSVNMFWDGLFHFFCLLVVLAGIFLLWKLGRRKDIDWSGRLLAGGGLLGWGLFNIVEGVINHHILKLHNVTEYTPHPRTANSVFLFISVIMLVTGYLLVRGKNSRAV